MNVQNIYDKIRLTVLVSVLLVLTCIALPFMLVWYACMIIGFPVVCISAMFDYSNVEDFADMLWRVYVKPWRDFASVFKDAFY